MGVMHCTAVLLDRSSAPRMTVISSSLRSPPRPDSIAWMSITAFSCARRNIACEAHQGGIRRVRALHHPAASKPLARYTVTPQKPATGLAISQMAGLAGMHVCDLQPWHLIVCLHA